MVYLSILLKKSWVLCVFVCFYRDKAIDRSIDRCHIVTVCMCHGYTYEDTIDSVRSIDVENIAFLSGIIKSNLSSSYS